MCPQNCKTKNTQKQNTPNILEYTAATTIVSPSYINVKHTTRMQFTKFTLHAYYCVSLSCCCIRMQSTLHACTVSPCSLRYMRTLSLQLSLSYCCMVRLFRCPITFGETKKYIPSGGRSSSSSSSAPRLPAPPPPSPSPTVSFPLAGTSGLSEATGRTIPPPQNTTRVAKTNCSRGRERGRRLLLARAAVDVAVVVS